MKTVFPFFGLAALLVVAPIRAADTASVEGIVPLAKPAAVAPLNVRYQSKPGVPAAPAAPNVAVVFLEVPGAPTNATPATVQMPQRNLAFSAGLLVIRRGTLVEFPNEDDLYHNVFSYSKAKRFDLGRYLKGEKPAAQLFDQAGVVKLYCEIHEHMRGTILVLDTPHFARTDTNGVFQLTGLPAGKFKLKAWVDEKTTLEREVELKPGTTARVDFSGP